MMMMMNMVYAACEFDRHSLHFCAAFQSLLQHWFASLEGQRRLNVPVTIVESWDCSAQQKASSFV